MGLIGVNSSSDMDDNYNWISDTNSDFKNNIISDLDAQDENNCNNLAWIAFVDVNITNQLKVTQNNIFAFNQGSFISTKPHLHITSTMYKINNWPYPSANITVDKGQMIDLIAKLADSVIINGNDWSGAVLDILRLSVRTPEQIITVTPNISPFGTDVPVLISSTSQYNFFKVGSHVSIRIETVIFKEDRMFSLKGIEFYLSEEINVPIGETIIAVIVTLPIGNNS